DTVNVDITNRGKGNENPTVHILGVTEAEESLPALPEHPDAHRGGDDCGDGIADQRGRDGVTCSLHADRAEVDGEHVEERFAAAVERGGHAGEHRVGAVAFDDV